MNRTLLSFFCIALIISLIQCEKDITVNLPRPANKFVVEGFIEQGEPPYVVLTRNSAYFDPIDSTSLFRMIIPDATVTVTDGLITDTLKFKLTQVFPYFRYVGKNIVGEAGKTYTLKITKADTIVTAVTTIPSPIAIDSLVFKPEKRWEGDSVGYVWFYFSDPDTIGNYYRTFTKTFGLDSTFVHPWASILFDDFVNGQHVEYPIYRGHQSAQGAASADNDNEEEEEEDENRVPDYLFRRGQRMVMKLCTIDRAHFKFWQSFQQNRSNSPFSAPSQINSNIQGAGIGIWGGYGVALDTLYIEKEVK